MNRYKNKKEERKLINKYKDRFIQEDKEEA